MFELPQKSITMFSLQFYRLQFFNEFLGVSREFISGPGLRSSCALNGRTRIRTDVEEGHPPLRSIFGDLKNWI